MICRPRRRKRWSSSRTTWTKAIKLADRISIIQDGKVAQCDTPENILKHPANQYVTEFIGANRLWANPEYIRAADIMRRRPFTISKGRTVIQALQIMRHNSVDSLLVLDKRGRRSWVSSAGWRS